MLDEISYMMSWGWIDPVEVANTVTEMVKVKHAFDRKIRAMKGIDY